MVDSESDFECLSAEGEIHMLMYRVTNISHVLDSESHFAAVYTVVEQLGGS